MNITEDVYPDDEYLELMSLEERVSCLSEFVHMIKNAEENKQFSLKHAKFALEKIQEKILISQDLINEADIPLQEVEDLIFDEYIKTETQEHLGRFEDLCNLIDDFTKTIKSFASDAISETDYRAGLDWRAQQESCNAGV
jgi:hypothetical protein